MSYMWQDYTKYKCSKDYYEWKDVYELFPKGVFGMIDKLKEYSIADQNTCYGHRAPSNWELMGKINELVEEINRLKEKFGEE